MNKYKYKMDPFVAKSIDAIQKEQNKILSQLEPQIREKFIEMEKKRMNLLLYGSENGIE